MAANALSDRFYYSSSSSIKSNKLYLSPAIKDDIEQPYFKGEFLKPRISALSLLILSKVVRTRFHTPPAMVQRNISESDPVVTCNGNEVLFEGFSACCSTYCRVDFATTAFIDSESGNGTTNVDFGAKMRSALSQIRDNNVLTLEVGQKGVIVEYDEKKVVEKKIPLPVRWIKSFSSVQSNMSEMEKFATLNRGDALRFIRTIPRTPSPRANYFINKAGRTLRFSQVERKGGLEIKAIERLLLLEDIIPIGEKLSIYSTPDSSATCWVVDSPSLQFTICISSDAWRGFSGEGRGLDLLVKEISEIEKKKMMASLIWDKNISISSFSKKWELSEEKSMALLNHFAQKGMLGYNLNSKFYFYRRLPYDLKSIEQLQPRLKKAQKLIDTKAVDFIKKDSLATASVKDGVNTHQVFIDDETARCTCTWYGKHKNDRGFCSHILSVKSLMEANSE